MKKIISCLVAVCMAAMSFVTVHCEDNIKVILDGKTLEFDVQPQIRRTRTCAYACDIRGIGRRC